MKSNRKSPGEWTASLVSASAVAFLSTLAASAPASLVPAAIGLARAGVGHEGATGTIWNGVLHRVSVDGVVIGDVAFKVAPLALVRGALEAEVASTGGAVRGAGIVTAGLDGSVRATRVGATVELAAFRHVRALGRPLEGKAAIANVVLDLDAIGRCLRAEGDVSTDAIVAVARSYGRQGFHLRGPLACRDGDAVVALQGEADGLSAAVEIRLKPGWTIGSVASLRGADDDVALALQSLGFRNDNGVWSTETGGISVGGS